MRHSEFWACVDAAYPEGLGRVFASGMFLIEFGTTAEEALEAGVPPLKVWHAFVKEMDLPEEFLYLHRRVRPRK